ncbi:MAG TPA: hypothetical protein VF157_05410, partial [Chloroflexota bacterium]
AALVGADGQTIGASALVGPLAAPPRLSLPDGLTPASAHFGETIELAGYEISDGAITLVWRALGEPDRDYTVFVHVLNASGQLVAQADGQPAGGDFPTSAWRSGDVVVDRHRLPKLLPGSLSVEVGFYYLPTLQRLPGGPLSFTLPANPG